MTIVPLPTTEPADATPAAAADPRLPATGRRRRTWRPRTWRRRWLGLLAGAYLLVLTVACVGASWWAPADPEFQDLAHPLAGPSSAHWLGTDRLGRDVLSRLLYGGQVTLIAVVEAVTVFAVLGITFGVLAGYFGGWLDRSVGWVADLLLALPGIIVLLMVLSVFPGNSTATMIVLGVISCPLLLRVTRGLTSSVRREPYVQAARLSGLGSAQVMRRHVLPRLVGPIIVQLSPASSERAVPASPTATSERPDVPGMNATPDMKPCGIGPRASRQVTPPSLVRATLSKGCFGLV